MSTEILVKGFLSLLYSLGLALVVYFRYDGETGSERAKDNGQRYSPVIHGSLLPFFILTLCVLGFFSFGARSTAKMALSMCFDIFLHISVYYMLLILVLPLIRKHISARSCAMLWLIPNYLYLVEQDYSEVTKPLLVIHASGKLVAILFCVWLTGFILVLGWNIINHLRFRSRILANAHSVTDTVILELLKNEIQDAALQNPKFLLVISPDIATPLSIGLFRGTMRLVLPDRQYSPEELRLIFRHEIVHIGREDAWAKFFLMFCTAMCWFNPLMWIAMRKSAEDLELSCDETVLLDADEDTRQQYARLLLRTAGDGRGFTTCLSAAAASMRYRLQCIVKPHKRYSGVILVGLTFFILCMSCGYVALAYGEHTGRDILFRHQSTSLYEAETITVTGGEYRTATDSIDVDALNRYLAVLPMQEMTGNYSFSEDNKSIYIWYQSPDGIVLVDLHSTYIQVLRLSEDDLWYTYHLPEPVDWAYLDGILPPLPAVEVELVDDTKTVHRSNATITGMTRISGDEKKTFIDRELQDGEGAGIFSHRTFREAAFTFSLPPVFPAEILIESWDHETSHTLTQPDMAQTYSIPLPEYPAHYTITATLRDGDGYIYETEFHFDIGNLDSV